MLYLLQRRGNIFHLGRTLSSSAILTVYMSFFVCLAAGLLFVAAAAAEMSADGNVMGGPPEKPDAFKNPGALKEYLKALNDYFAIVGRPRY